MTSALAAWKVQRVPQVPQNVGGRSPSAELDDARIVPVIEPGETYSPYALDVVVEARCR